MIDLTGLGAALGASALINLGIVLQALDARHSPKHHAMRFALLTTLMRRPRWVLGMVVETLGFPLQVYAFAHASFLVVEPALAAGLLLLLGLSAKLLGERVDGGAVAGVLAITGGIALLAWGQPDGPEHLGTISSVVGVVGGLSTAAIAPLLFGRERNWAMFPILASAIGFGAGNIATKLVSAEFTSGRYVEAGIWIAVLAGTSIVAILTKTTALQRRPATLVVPVLFAVQIFLPILLEPFYLTARLGAGALTSAPVAGGLALVLLGVVAVSRTRAVAAFAGA